ncbi:hypothetical protein NL676_036700 [Syzygium grande]|nr:hypothetical protein NL676_036700 [Syzygium grande]
MSGERARFAQLRELRLEREGKASREGGPPLLESALTAGAGGRARAGGRLPSARATSPPPRIQRRPGSAILDVRKVALPPRVATGCRTLEEADEASRPQRELEECGSGGGTPRGLILWRFGDEPLLRLYRIHYLKLQT